MAIADELIALLGFKLDGADAAKRYEAILGNLTNKIGLMAAAAAKMAGIAAGAMITGFGALGGSVIATSAKFQDFQSTLETIEGSSEAAKKALDWISDFGKKTPYDVEQVTASFVKLKAFGIDPIANDTLRILGDTASAMGKTLDQAVEMFTDASSGEFERLKEFGLRASTEGDKVTFTWSKNGKELTKTLKKNGEEIRQFLLEQFGDRFEGAMDKKSRNWNGMISNLGDTWIDFQRRIGDAGFFDNVSKKLAWVLDSIQKLDDQGRLDEWAKSLSQSLEWTADVVFAVAKRIGENVIFLIDNFEHLQTPLLILAGIFGFMVARAFPLITIFTILAFAVDDFLAYLQGGESKIGQFIEWIKELTGVSDTVAQSLAGLGGVVGAALTAAFVLAPVKSLRLFATILTVGMRGVFWTVGTVALTAIARLGPLLLAGFTALAPIVMKGALAAFALLSNPIGWAVLIGGVAAGLIWYFWDELVVAWDQLKARATTLWNGFRDLMLNIDWTGAGIALMNKVWAGMKQVGEEIKAWFVSLVPDWAKDAMGIETEGGPVAETNIQQTGETTPSEGNTLKLTPEALDRRLQLQNEETQRVLGNLNENLARMVPERATEVVATDARQDNRQFPLTNNVTINQTVTQATNAGSQAAQATASAVSGTLATQRTQIESGPSF